MFTQSACDRRRIHSRAPSTVFNPDNQLGCGVVWSMKRHEKMLLSMYDYVMQWYRQIRATGPERWLLTSRNHRLSSSVTATKPHNHVGVIDVTDTTQERGRATRCAEPNSRFVLNVLVAERCEPPRDVVPSCFGTIPAQAGFSEDTHRP